MIVRTSSATRFDLLKDKMVECGGTYYRYSLSRLDLRYALKNGMTRIRYKSCDSAYAETWNAWIVQGVTQRHKRFISIGCMKFVGENRTKLIRWAKAGK